MSSPHFAALLTCTGYVVDDVQRSFKDYVNRIKIDRSIIHFTKAQFCNFVSVWFNCSILNPFLAVSCFEVMMCGLCLFLGRTTWLWERKKLPTAEQTKILSVHKTELVLGFFFFFSVSIMVQRLCLTKVSANKYWKISLVSLLSLFFHSIPQFSEAQM